MKRSAFVVLAVSLAGSSALRAQSTTPQPPSEKKIQGPATARKGTTLEARDSVTIADVQKAADELALAVQAVVKKVTENPELKVAALNLATNAVTAAQLVVNQQAATLQATLEALAKQVAAASAQQSKSKSH
jgi:hypothetical protein